MYSIYLSIVCCFLGHQRACMLLGRATLAAGLSFCWMMCTMLSSCNGHRCCFGLLPWLYICVCLLDDVVMCVCCTRTL